MSDKLIITGSFNGLLDRLARIDYWNVWVEGRTLLKNAKKDRIEATMPMSEVLTLTGLTIEDIELFLSLGLISVIDACEDPLLSAKGVFTLTKIFERFVDEGIITRSG